MSEPSNWIKNAITPCGTPVQVCDFCNRTHYVASGRFMDDGELEEIMKKEAAEPEKYCANVMDDSISCGQIEGKTYVWGCGCKESEERLSRIENWIWNHRHLIATYLELRVKSMREEVESASHVLKVIQEKCI